MTKPILKKDRAAIVFEKVVERGSLLGQWAQRQKGNETISVWVVEADAHWSAQFDFIDASSVNPKEATDPLAGLQQSFLVDVWSKAEGIKVLSCRWDASARAIKVVTMRPGPWEKQFGLLPQNWNPSHAEKLDQRQAAKPMTDGELVA